MRTPEEFVEDMLRKGRDWVAILAVGRVVRNGNWQERVEKILVDRGLMPSDPAVRDKLRLETWERFKKAEREKEEAIWKKSRKSSSSTPSTPQASK